MLSVYCVILVIGDLIGYARDGKPTPRTLKQPITEEHWCHERYKKENEMAIE